VTSHRRTASVGVGSPDTERPSPVYPILIGPAAGHDGQTGWYGTITNLYISVTDRGRDGREHRVYTARPGDTADAIAAKAAHALAEHASITV